MDHTLGISLPDLEAAERIIRRAASRWTGCNWQTEFGPLRLNLMGMRSRQASLMAEATPGEESAAWQHAAQFLLAVEADAESAATVGQNAVRLLAEGRRGEAIEQAKRAVALESKYRPSEAWQPLVECLAE
jgi:hypothetical protein